MISHPRFYWGEAGNVNTPPLFKLPIPASRSTVPTGYGYVLPDQNGWSRYLHFQTAWVAVLTGLLYVISSLFTGHLRKNLLPAGADLSWRAFSTEIANHLRFKRPSEEEAWSYNVLQRLTYLLVIFVLFPLVSGRAWRCHPPSHRCFRLRSLCWAASNPLVRSISL